MFYICKKCGNLVGMIYDSGINMVCCEEEMTKIESNIVEASKDKHIPIVTVNEKVVIVSVGEIDHPMEEKHHISWIYLETKKGGQRKTLKVSEKPFSEFTLVNDEAIAAYSYCNVHGLWKKNI